MVGIAISALLIADSSKEAVVSLTVLIAKGKASEVAIGTFLRNFSSIGIFLVTKGWGDILEESFVASLSYLNGILSI